MKHGCPNQKCEFFNKREKIVKFGRYKRKDDSRILQRYRCKSCGKTFSPATFNLAKYQKKRRKNLYIMKFLASGMSMRRLALNFNLNRKTIHRKCVYWHKYTQRENTKLRHKIKDQPLADVQVDDLITYEHTKLKPISIPMIVCSKTRLIVGFEVAKIPAFGVLAKLSRQKYGDRPSQHAKKLDDLFAKSSCCIQNDAFIRSDEHKSYPVVIRKYFSKSKHLQYKGAKGCVVGQGELKKQGFDPIFSVNHTLAMLRANINRLIRRTWCSTKNLANLEAHLEIYTYFHNNYLIHYQQVCGPV